jgi:hypothetical protein
MVIGGNAMGTIPVATIGHCSVTVVWEGDRVLVFPAILVIILAGIVVFGLAVGTTGRIRV